MKVTVTADHIARGMPQSPFLCPIALALHEHEGLELARVAANAVFVRDRVFYLSREAVHFMFRYDTGKRVEPFSFAIPVEELVL